MSIQHVPEATIVEEGRSTGHAGGVRRWLVPAGLLAVAATSLTLIARDRDGADSATVRTSDFTRSQVLVQRAIDDALAENRPLQFTRSQVLVQRAIDDALASRNAAPNP